jgi:hypothetical protein
VLRESLPVLPFHAAPVDPGDAVVLWSGKTIVVGFPKDDGCLIYVRTGSNEELKAFGNEYSIGIDWF